MALKLRYSPLQRFSFENLFASYTESPPARKAIALSVVGAIFLLLFFLPLSLISGKVGSLQTQIDSTRQGYTQVADKVMEYRKIQSDLETLEGKFSTSAGALSSKVENVVKQSGLNVDQVREKAPQETDFLTINSIEVKLSSVSLGQLIEILDHLENDPSVTLRIRRIQVKPKNSNRQILDVSFEVATFVLRKEA